jgi:hypothetical protein
VDVVCVFVLSESADPAADPAAAAAGRRYILASFHGDSAGRSTAPALAALDALAAERYPDHVLLVGLDASTVTAAVTDAVAAAAGGGGGPGGEGLGWLEAVLAEVGLASCWAGWDARDVWTAFSARTALQLHRAAAPAAVLDPRHRALKNWVLFRPAQLALAAPAARTNRGDGRLEACAMPARD